MKKFLIGMFALCQMSAMALQPISTSDILEQHNLKLLGLIQSVLWTNNGGSVITYETPDGVLNH
ncbi:MAG: hypothetical protein ACRC5M_06425, partial [Anaeroplasmataceae bacterium]